MRHDRLDGAKVPNGAIAMEASTAFNLRSLEAIIT